MNNYFEEFIKEYRLFFKEWLKAPLRMGGVVPSSKFLGAALCKQANISQNDYIVELGAGTGSVTREILKLATEDKLFIFEKDEKFIKVLRSNFPNCTTINDDAANIWKIIQKHNVKHIDAVISCLPLLLMPNETRESILLQAFRSLAHNGKFVQFTHLAVNPFNKAFLANNNLEIALVDKVYLNIPPAYIWVVKNLIKK